MTDYGYVRVGAGVPSLKVADIDFNREGILAIVNEAVSKGVEVLVMPELGVTGYTCGDLFEQPLLQKKAEESVREIVKATSGKPITFAVGSPVVYEGKRYNCAIIISGGKILGIVPKTHIPNYGEFYEKRWFHPWDGKKEQFDIVEFAGETVAFGTDILVEVDGVKIGVEICEDLWVPVPPSCRLSQSGADVILNLSASDELIGKHDYLLRLVSQQSARCRCAYVYASAGWGESSTDLVFAGNAIIGEDGVVEEYPERFVAGSILKYKDVDIERLRNDRLRYSTFHDDDSHLSDIRVVKGIPVESDKREGEPYVDPFPFVPGDEGRLEEHCEEIVNIQARGLMQRLNAISCRNAVIGISGGLDSTLALLVTVRAFDLLGLDRKGIVGITMPGMATTSRTRNNAIGLMEELGVTSLEIPIGKSVAQHFSDIGQSPDNYDVTYENSQARERTQILMDYANKINGLVIGTGDMSELALGWCTYNGDHMSMYGVNASVPKTLVKYLVKWFAGEFTDRASGILLDIVDTPISPELVPSGKDSIGQKTEDLVGPYELHDFYMYHLLRNAFTPRKVYWLSQRAFGDRYDNSTLLKWQRNFYRRFFSQQFKRSCMPDGPKVGSVCLSPRGDWRMPSDASSALWLSEMSVLEEENSNGK
ncbi:MAG: NAD(+) synthase [Muribaculaceae bacterium]|nr:NAD(+) synthase [Muribaculaceae bacterium]